MIDTDYFLVVIKYHIGSYFMWCWP